MRFLAQSFLSKTRLLFRPWIFLLHLLCVLRIPPPNFEICHKWYVLPVWSSDKLSPAVVLCDVIQGNENGVVEGLQFHHQRVVVSPIRAWLPVQIVRVSVPGTVLLKSQNTNFMFLSRLKPMIDFSFHVSKILVRLSELSSSQNWPKSRFELQQ